MGTNFIHWLNDASTERGRIACHPERDVTVEDGPVTVTIMGATCPACIGAFERSLPSEKPTSTRTTKHAEGDSVNHPDHYNSHPSGIECIEIVRHMGFNLGNVVKYLWRDGLKETEVELQDLKKALFYLRDEINQRETGGWDRNQHTVRRLVDAVVEPVGPDGPAVGGWSFIVDEGTTWQRVTADAIDQIIANSEHEQSSLLKALGNAETYGDVVYAAAPKQLLFIPKEAAMADRDSVLKAVRESLRTR